MPSPALPLRSDPTRLPSRTQYEQLDHRVYKVLRSYPAKLKGIRVRRRH